MSRGTLKAAVIITAAGSSQRMGSDSKKEFLEICNTPVLLLAVKPFINLSLFSKYVILLSGKDIDRGKDILSTLSGENSFIFASGGITRQESVYNGLLALKKESPDIVLIHDGARPWVSEAVIRSVLNGATVSDASVPVIPSVNAMKTIDAKGIVVANLQREFTVAAQTPQGFKYRKILESYQQASSDGIVYIDDAEIFSKYSGTVSTVPGDIANKKITYKSDLPGRKQASCPAMSRTGGACTEERPQQPKKENR